jgi:glucose/arabinose dehydrogenase
MAGERLGKWGAIRMVLPRYFLSAMIFISLSRMVSALPADFERKDWVAGLTSPLAMKWSPDGRLFVLEQAGKVRVVKDGALLPTPFATVKAWVGHRESMLGVAFDPKFATNGYVYLYYSEDGKQQNRITRLTSSKTDANVAETGSEVVLLDGIGSAGYQGGAFFFGKDGMLYAGSAHGGSQDLNNLGGKVLRLNPAAYPNVIPADNPFVGKAGARAEIWAYGFREPFTGAADTVTGDMVVNDVGEGTAEEVDVLKKGGNFGYEGGCEGSCTKADMVNPWIEYTHGVGNCITGAAFYYGQSFPAEYRGSFFYADYGATWIKRKSAAGVISDFDSGNGKVIQLDVGPDGSLYLLKINGENPPWTGSVQRVKYNGLVSVAPNATPGAAGPMGPRESIVHARTQSVLRFQLGVGGLSSAKDQAREASVTVYDHEGRRVKSMSAHFSSGSSKTLDWNLQGDVPGAGAYYYALDVVSESGRHAVKQGRILFLE